MYFDETMYNYSIDYEASLDDCLSCQAWCSCSAVQRQLMNLREEYRVDLMY